MIKKVSLFFILALLISFATVNAVLFTPALPNLADLFNVSIKSMETTFIWFLMGYSFGQLLYGPLDDRFGRKCTLYVGLSLQILSNILSLIAGYFTNFHWLLLSRFLLALGAGVGLMMTFTIVSEVYEKKYVQTIIAYLIPAFALVPALAIFFSGYFTHRYGWPANFYLAILYGLVMMLLCSYLPASNKAKDLSALQLNKIYRVFSEQLRHKLLIINGILMGCCVVFVYIFSTIVPFVTVTYFQLNSLDYGVANGFSALGLLTGAIISAKIKDDLSPYQVIKVGVFIIALGALNVLLGEYFNLSAFFTFFASMFLINLGSCFVLSNAAAIVLDKAKEKAQASSVMSFINVGTTALIMLVFSYLPLGHYLLASTFMGLSLIMFVLISCFSIVL